jgi:hypothetical protein
MLRTNTILPETLDILNGIMSVPELNAFSLAGGTALALQIGHRMSADLDFFGNRSFEKDEITDLTAHLGNIRLMNQTKNILVININGIKVDFVNYKYHLLTAIIIEDKIRMFDLPDIGAMKLAAITGRGRKRDFTDLFFLLQKYSLPEMISFYNNKYPDGSEFLVVRSLTYFDDADNDEELKLITPYDWNKIKAKVIEEVLKLYS